ncbi:MAG: GHKL domain-containing protein [Ignavibacteriaceae bacterium]|nr:GHKL domain-containing protein [Ignavibacteriaceae bacterium]
MNTTTRKIGIILLSVILLPALIFSVYQIATLNQSEKMLGEIYSNQLDVLLFSVNQYSEDITGRLQNELNIIMDKKDDQAISGELKNFINENTFIKKIIFTDSTFGSTEPEIKKLLQANREKISKLYLYKKENYNRVEPIEYQKSTFLFFILNDSITTRLAGILIDSDKFITDVLTDKILSIAKNEFSIYLFNKENVYDFNSDGDKNPYELAQQRKLWLLPGYSIAIKLRGETIDDLVKQRTKNNLIMLTGLIVVLLAGGWFVFRNIRKEVELAQIKSEFVSNVSHELRTPLSLISMFAETLEMGRVKTDEKKMEYYSIISQEASRLSNIVNKILSFSKIEAGKRNFTFKEHDLNEIVEHIFESYKFHLQNNGFEFIFHKHSFPLKITADADAISEAVINLLDNAAKYSKDKKYIEMKTAEERSTVFVEIIDKGIGIQKEDQKRIFEKFYRVKSGFVHNTKGTGLGLSLVKQIMDAHKGEVAIVSELGKGSSFKLKFKKHN